MTMWGSLIFSGACSLAGVILWSALLRRFSEAWVERKHKQALNRRKKGLGL